MSAKECVILAGTDGVIISSQLIYIYVNYLPGIELITKKILNYKFKLSEMREKAKGECVFAFIFSYVVHTLSFNVRCQRYFISLHHILKLRKKHRHLPSIDECSRVLSSNHNDSQKHQC